jgi:hypothetical protein
LNRECHCLIASAVKQSNFHPGTVKGSASLRSQ